MSGNQEGPPPIDGKTIFLPSGLEYIDIIVGAGDVAHTNQLVTVHYTGWLSTGTKFDSSRDRQRPFPFKLGAGDVIVGWDLGVAGMRIGGQRRLIIPHDLAYGVNGRPPVIPPRSTLIFDIELLSVG